MKLSTITTLLSLLLLTHPSAGEGKTEENRRQPHLHNLRHPRNCNDNEEWVECRSSSCFDLTCADIVRLGEEQSEDIICSADCDSGCACKEGFVRDEEDGLCYDNVVCFDTAEQL